MVQPLVNIKNIGMKYQSLNGEIDAIRDVSFDVSHGEFLSIVGPSGCGKSTLLSIISGLLKPTGGSVWLDGEEVSDTSSKVGFMPQKDHLFDWRTIYQNVTLGLEIRGMMNKENTDYVAGLLKTYGLYDFKDKYPGQLSGGMRQRAALIRTLAVRPEILLLDEAFSALDYQTRLAVTDDIYTIIKNEHKTAIMVTHDIAESISMSDRVVVLSRRPAVVTAIHDISFDIPERKPLACREAAEFPHYFNTIWKELDVHV